MAAGRSEKSGLFFADLDGTLIFSARDKRPGDIVIERKDGEEITCVTARQAELLPLLSDVIIPLTSRSLEQYRRVKIPGFSPRYALCSNGGTLLVNGVPDEEWLRQSRELVNPAADELEHFRGLLEKDEDRSFELRLVDGFFLVTKSAYPEKTLERLGVGELCGCFVTNQTVYVVPNALGKGEAVRRFAERFWKKIPKIPKIRITAAGDALMDVTMLNRADRAVFTENIPEELVSAPEKIIRPRENFPEFLTYFCVKTQKNRNKLQEITTKG